MRDTGDFLLDFLKAVSLRKILFHKERPYD